jgi:hypothetical protein
VRERATKHGINLDVTVDERLGDFVGDERKIKGSSPYRVGKNGAKSVSLRAKITCFSGQQICHRLRTRKHQRLCDRIRFPAFCPEQQEPCDLKTKGAAYMMRRTHT